jgi:molybdopterin/thiamine biosynthesis adenylyltransferase
MPGKFHHEVLYRGSALITRLSALRITLCGAGALGSHLADNLVRQGITHLRVIDKDRVEEQNVSTQLYGESDIGAWKVEVLRNRLFKTAGVEIQAVRKELAAQTAKPLLGECDLIIDAFDNSASRRLVQQTARIATTPCLHVGLHTDYGEIIWDETYRVPADVAGDVCDYPLARNLILLAVAITTEAIVRYSAAGERQSWSVTLADFAIRPIASDPAQ